MKTVKVTLRTWVLMVSTLFIATTSSFAIDGVKDDVKLVVKPISDSKKVLFGLAHLQGQSAELQIFDGQGRVIYRELWKNRQEGAHIFNFSQLEEGEYKFRVTIGDQVLQESVLINKGEIHLSQQAVLLPHVNVSNRKVVLSLANASNTAFDFTLRFFDASGELVYTEKPEVEGVQFAKRYNFEKMAVGTYTYSIAYGAQTFNGQFEIK